MNKIFVIILLAIPVVSSAGVFPASNGIALKGVTEFDASARVMATVGVGEVIDRSSFQTTLNDAFVLGLRRDGVGVSPTAPNYLECNVQIGGNGPGTIVYSYLVQFYDYDIEGLNTLLWSHGGMSTVGSNNLTAKDVAQACVDVFASAWLEQNPK